MQRKDGMFKVDTVYPGGTHGKRHFYEQRDGSWLESGVVTFDGRLHTCGDTNNSQVHDSGRCDLMTHDDALRMCQDHNGADCSAFARTANVVMLCESVNNSTVQNEARPEIAHVLVSIPSGSDPHYTRLQIQGENSLLVAETHAK